ncbi:GNAT family N-acetyltransferase [Paenibacillus sp. MY03]|uniref:GNAT family N-acetyltransferase n=1 Tax=Paenibacillus sp. MY03 TaxID=302980 RepID=UPI000B3C78C1|nr:GNAT family N-acetyltransferase [Paenibacillus sp. MY03]OUS73045.1 GNAT family N-acetyltransferase [Paenibacillus sp. MY03]
MDNELKVKQITSIAEYVKELSELLMEVVEDGASLGFLPPLGRAEATEYWENLIKPDVLIFIAEMNNRIVGSVQLHICTKPNGSHRAEIAKLMTHPRYRRMGIGRSLMQKVEVCAKREERSLLVLDTRDGDPSNDLYASLGYIQAGRIPCYAKSANGELHATNIYYKFIG